MKAVQRLAIDLGSEFTNPGVTLLEHKKERLPIHQTGFS